MKEHKSTKSNPIYDVFVIGGGVNGTGIARDASGRGLNVCLVEMNDLASATSSASTKLFHGGLRYLEYFKFKLVKESLKEREVLLKSMPHISWPMRFILPVYQEMRFDLNTPTSRLVNGLMPWMKGKRPVWLIRFGLFLYDNLGGRELLPGTKTLRLNHQDFSNPLKEIYSKAYEYSDCWVDDARLVVLNARDAALRGAKILTRTQFLGAKRINGLWQIEVQNQIDKKVSTYQSRSIVNAAGPWVKRVIDGLNGNPMNAGVQLIKGSHIITKKLYSHDRCYFFQGKDGRIIFVIPYENEFSLIGTTDLKHPSMDTTPSCSNEEKEYLCSAVSEYFKQPIEPKDIIASFSGVRALYDDGSDSASAVSREYSLQLDETTPPILNVYGGKITTYRKLAEATLKKLKPFFPKMKKAWTKKSHLPGGDFKVTEFSQLVKRIQSEFHFLDEKTHTRLARSYGSEVFQIFDGVKKVEDLGQYFGYGLYAKEIDWGIQNEWVLSAEDFLLRRSKMILHLSEDEVLQVRKYIEEKVGQPQ